MSKKRILLIEDTADLRVVAKMSLEFGGFEVVEAEDGFKGVAAATSQQFDLILLDMMMPGMDGPEVLKKLREHQPPIETPVVFFSAKAKPQEIADGMKLGVHGYITKPFDPMELPKKVGELIETG